MSALSIQPTFPVFTDIDGQPLEAGYIFIGTANLNPITNPINVFFDAALTQPAVQPIRTISGYPSNAGTPARLYVNSDYSIQVQNKNGTLVYSAPTATERYSDVVVTSINAEEVIYDPPFTNAVQTNVEAKLAETVSVKDFGAVGDGVADDTAAIQAAIDHCVITKQSLYIPAGIYIIDELVIDFGVLNVNRTKQGFIMYGDGGQFERVYNQQTIGNSVLRYAGTSGSAIRTTGVVPNPGQSFCDSMQFKNFVIQGTGGSFSFGPPAGISGSTAIGLSLVGATNHALEQLCITGFDTGIYLLSSYVGIHNNCKFVQNNIGCNMDSGVNNITSIQTNYHQNWEVNLVIDNKTLNFFSRNLTFINALLEGGPSLGVLINSAAGPVSNIVFINPYFENNSQLFEIGYSLAGVESTNVINDILIDVLDYNGIAPTTVFKASKLDTLTIKNYAMQNSVPQFDFTDTVKNVFVGTQKLFTGAFNLPVRKGAFKNNFQRKSPYNLIIGGNYLISGGSFNKTTAAMTESYGFEDGEPVLTLTIPNGGPYDIRWAIENLSNAHGQIVNLFASIQLVSGVTASVGVYNQSGVPFSGLLSAFSTTSITTLGSTFAIPNTATRGTVRVIFNNSTGVDQNIKIRNVGLFSREAGPIQTDALDVLVSLSGTVSCTPTATINVPFSVSTDYRVIVTPLANATAFVTKSATSFVITTSVNASVDYVVIPLGRVLQ